MDHFRERFRDALQQVLAVYPDARISEETDGIRLEESPPPIPKIRVFLP
jgi:hypothetical protein